jgi:hypothetical protein
MTLKDSGLEWNCIALQLLGQITTSCRDRNDLFYKQALMPSPETDMDKAGETTSLLGSYPTK